MGATMVMTTANMEGHGDDTLVNVTVRFFLVGNEEIGEGRTEGNGLHLLDGSSFSRDGVSTKTLLFFAL